MVKPTTPIFLSDVEAAPVDATYPVVYSPVPTMRTAGGDDIVTEICT